MAAFAIFAFRCRRYKLSLWRTLRLPLLLNDAETGNGSLREVAAQSKSFCPNNGFQYSTGRNSFRFASASRRRGDQRRKSSNTLCLNVIVVGHTESCLFVGYVVPRWLLTGVYPSLQMLTIISHYWKYRILPDLVIAYLHAAMVDNFRSRTSFQLLLNFRSAEDRVHISRCCPILLASHVKFYHYTPFSGKNEYQNIILGGLRFSYKLFSLYNGEVVHQNSSSKSNDVPSFGIPCVEDINCCNNLSR